MLSHVIIKLSKEALSQKKQHDENQHKKCTNICEHTVEFI